MHHFGSNLALQKCQHVITPNGKTHRRRVVGKSLVELGGRDIAPLKMGPGVVVGVGGVDGPNGVEGESLSGLKAVKSLERAAQDHPTEIPQNSRNSRRTSHTSDRRAIPTCEPY